MIDGKRIIIVMPAYNAANTLQSVYNELDFNLVDDVVLVDDHSQDNTMETAKKLGITHVIRHEENLGYGGNQLISRRTLIISFSTIRHCHRLP